MGRPKGSGNRNPYPETRHYKFYWKVIDQRFSKEVQSFKGMHNRVRDGKSPSIAWPRTLDGFICFLREIGPAPRTMIKPSVGRKRHSLGYEAGNIAWEEHAINSRKRRGTRYES